MSSPSITIAKTAITDLLNNNAPEKSITPNRLAEVITGAIDALDTRYAFGGVATPAAIAAYGEVEHPTFFLVNVQALRTNLSAIGGPNSSVRGLYSARNRADGSGWVTSLVVDYSTINATPLVSYPIEVDSMGRLALGYNSLSGDYFKSGAITGDRISDSSVGANVLSSGLHAFKIRHSDVTTRGKILGSITNVLELSIADLPVGCVMPVYVAANDNIEDTTNTKVSVVVMSGTSVLEEETLRLATNVRKNDKILCAFISRSADGSIIVCPSYPFCLV